MYSSKEDKRAYDRLWYQRNKRSRVALNAAYKAKIRKQVQVLKEQSPCLDCKLFYPYYVMQYDHVRGAKLGNVATMAGCAKGKAVKVEIEKCDLVCANCHAIRTYKRRTSITSDAPVL